MGLNLTNSDYSLSHNFQLCYNCGEDRKKMNECKICEEKTTHEMHANFETMRCNSCKFYSHLKCSRLSLAQLDQLMSEINS